MKRQNRSKVLALLMALLLAFQLLPGGVAFADGPGDKLPDEQVSIHKRDHEPDTQVSFIKITKDGTTYTPDPVTGEYKDIPAGAEIEFQIGFHLEDGVGGNEEEPYDYQPGEYFTVNLPEGLSFPDLQGDVLTQAGGTKFAEWSIDQATNTLTITLTDGVIAMGYGKQGVFGFNGSFQYLNGEDDTAAETQIDFGGDIVKITRKPFKDDHPPVAKGTVSKKGNYNTATNKINWTVEVMPPEGGSLDGYTLVDVLTEDHSYTSGDTFKVNGTPAFPSVSADEKTISYTFNGNITTKQTVIYTTTPDAGTLGGREFTNTAHLEKSTEIASNYADATVSMDGFFDKAAGNAVTDPDTGDTYVPWTVTVTLPATDGEYVLTNAKIIDTIADNTGYAQHEFVDTATYPVKIQLPGQSAVNVVGTPATGYYSVSNGILTYTFPTGHPETATVERIYKLTYYTHVYDWKNDYKDNEEVNVKNKADFEWGGTGGPGTGWSFGNVGIEREVKPAGGLLAKSLAAGESGSEPYIYKNDDVEYIQWSIEIDRNKVDLETSNGKILLKDTLPAGLDFVINATYKLVLTDGTTPKEYTEPVTDELTITTSGTPSRNSGFTLDLLEATGETKIGKPYTVTFWSKMNETGRKEFYKTSTNSSNGNGSVSFTNVAELECSVPDLTSHATKEFTSQMMNKSVGGYDYSTRLAKWTIVVNRNQLEIGGAAISDTLPAGLKLYIDGTHPFGVAGGTIASNSAEDGGGGFNIVFPPSTTSTYTITYWTKVQDDVLITKGDKSFPNTANLTLVDNTKFSSSSTLTIKNEVITKSTDYVANSGDTITWSVKVNPAQIDLKDATIEDDLISALSYVTGSAKLYAGTVAQNGDLTKTIPATLVTEGFNVTVTGQKVTVDLPDGHNAYVLEFDTMIVQDTADIVNSIKFSGNSQTNAGTSTAKEIKIKNLYSSGSSGAESFVIEKVDENGNPMQGVEFTLLNASKQPFKYTTAAISGGAKNKDTTDENGTITFKTLPDWVLYVEEIDSPEGYLRAPIAGGVRPSQKLTGDDAGINIKVVNELALAKVEISKRGINIPLSGGTFVLTGQDVFGKEYKDATAITAHADANGVVSFGNLPMGAYTIKETAAPTGHIAFTGEIQVVVGYTSSDKTAVQALYSYGTTSNAASYTLVNEPDPTGVNQSESLSFTKISSDGTPLAGAKFELRKQSPNDKVAEATSGADGKVTFDEIPIGDYYIYETATPDGYLNPNATPSTSPIFKVKVSYNSANTALQVEIRAESGAPAGAFDETAKTFKNTPAVGEVKFTKKDSASDTVKINGGTFVIEGTGLSGQTVAITSTAVDGVVTFQDVPVGDDYTIRETVPPSGYFLTTKTLTGIQVKYTDNTKTAVADLDLTADPGSVLTNDLIPYVPGEGKAAVTKVDEDGKVLSGATFTLYDSNGKAVASMTTGTDGLATFTKLKPYSSYTIKETAAPAGYELSGEVLTVTTKYSSVLTFTMINKKTEVKLGSASILKTDAGGKKLPGATFTLYDGDNKAVATAVTGQDGVAVFKELTPGATYTVKETVAPIGYQLSGEILTLNVTAGATLSFTVVNRRLDEAGKGDVRILKTDANGAALGGATFTLYDAEGRAVASATSGADGGVVFTGIPAKASYTVKETAAPSGYALSGEVLSISLEAGQVATYTVVNHKLDEPGTTPILGSLSVMKVDSANVRLAGAEFTLYDASGKVYASTVTGADGIARFTNLPLGSYSVAETRAPQGYSRFSGSQAVELTADKASQSFTLRNVKDGESPYVAGWEEIGEPPVPGGPGTPGGTLPKTGEIPTSFYLLLAGLSLLGAGFATAWPRKKDGKRLLSRAKK
jgi:LPXTG-motif cell wall-anchored protein